MSHSCCGCPIVVLQLGGTFPVPIIANMRIPLALRYASVSVEYLRWDFHPLDQVTLVIRISQEDVLFLVGTHRRWGPPQSYNPNRILALVTDIK